MRTSDRRVTLFLSIIVLCTAATAQSNGSLNIADFGMQCGISNSANCSISAGVVNLPTQPGLLRLWDSSVQWSQIEQTKGTYTWGNLNSYLYGIASDPTAPAVIYTFGDVPCWDVSGSCTGSGTLPDDIGTGACGSGSCTFDSFVTALTNHCAPKTTKFPNGVCTKDVIKYYEMWNEFDNPNFWTGTTQQLFNMVSSAVGIIKTNITGAKILTPSVDASGESAMATWTNFEANSASPFSDYYNFHAYLNTDSPESVWSNVVQQTIVGGNGLLYPNYNTPSPWKPLPWLISETNFQAQLNSQGQLIGFACTFSQQDCIGQIVRWQILLNANGWSAPAGTAGSSNLSWYWWNATIGANAQYDTAYSLMEGYLANGSFTQSCSSSGSVSAATLTCPFKEGSGTTALWVWTNTEAGLTYTVPANFVDYRGITASGKTCVTPGTQITITVEPIMLEQASSCP